MSFRDVEASSIEYLLRQIEEMIEYRVSQFDRSIEDIEALRSLNTTRDWLLNVQRDQACAAPGAAERPSETPRSNSLGGAAIPRSA